MKIPINKKSTVYIAKDINTHNIKKYNISFNNAVLGNYSDIYNLSLKILDDEIEGSEFENNLISYLDSCEPLFNIADTLRFNNLCNIVKEHNLLLIVGIIESGLECKVTEITFKGE